MEPHAIEVATQHTPGFKRDTKIIDMSALGSKTAVAKFTPKDMSYAHGTYTYLYLDFNPRSIGWSGRDCSTVRSPTCCIIQLFARSEGNLVGGFLTIDRIVGGWSIGPIGQAKKRGGEEAIVVEKF